MSTTHSDGPASSPGERRRRDVSSIVPAAVEALAYLGGILLLVGLVLLVGAYWGGMPSGIRVAIPSITTAIALSAAWFAVRRPVDSPAPPAPFVRMQVFLWMVAAAASSVTGGVSAHEFLGRPSTRAVVAVGAISAVTVSAALWRGRPRPIPQAATMTAALVAIGTGLTGASNTMVGFILVGVAVVLVVLGFERMTTSPWITLGIGGAGLLVGSALVADTYEGSGMLMIDAAVIAFYVISLGPLRRTAAEQRAALTIAVIGTWSGVPQSVGHFADGAALVTGAVVWSMGLTIAVAAARSLSRHPRVVEAAGGLCMIGGAALTARESVALAVVWGAANAVALLAAGTRSFALSALGSLGLLINVPWAIVHFLPGERRAPIALLSTGVVLVSVAVVLVRRLSRRGSITETPAAPPTI